jgi:hypothetical protein
MFFLDFLTLLLSGMFQNVTPGATELTFPDVPTTLLLLQQMLAF